MTGRMEGKKAVVVGSGQLPSKLTGIGRAIAELFAREGAEVCVVDRILDRAEDTVGEIRDAGGRAHAIRADVGTVLLQFPGSGGGIGVFGTFFGLQA